MNTDYSYKFEVSDSTFEQEQSESYIPAPKCVNLRFRTLSSRTIQLLTLGLVVLTLVFTIALFTLSAFQRQDVKREHTGDGGASFDAAATGTRANETNLTTPEDQVTTNSPNWTPDSIQMSSTAVSAAGHKYAFSTNKVNWFQALQRCRTLGMELLSLETQMEKNFLDVYIRKVSEPYDKSDRDWWTSGTNQYTDSSVFYWASNGQKMNFKFWHTGMPNQPSTQNCVEITPMEGFGTAATVGEFRWNDYECYQVSKFICEYPDRDPRGGYVQL